MVSIIMPTYNRSKTLAQSIESVLKQTYKDWQLIVVDDGSTDNTEDLMAAYKDDKRIIYYKQANAGPIKARNNGARLAEGEWLAFLDSDDEWLPEKLEKQLAMAEGKGDVLIFGNFFYVDETGKIIGEFFKDKSQPYSGKILPHLLLDNFILTSSVLVNKKIFDEVGGFNEKLDLTIGEDYELWLRIADKAEFYFVAEPIANYRVHSVQLTKKRLSVYWSQLKLFIYLFKNASKYEAMDRLMVVKSFLLRIKRVAIK